MKNVWRVLLTLSLAVPFVVPVRADIHEAKAVLQGALERLQEYGGPWILPSGGEGSAWFVWNMNPGYYKCIDRVFYRGSTYALVASGDSRVSDVDLKVLDENNNLVVSDTDSSRTAVVRFTPRFTGMYHIRTIYYAGAPVGSLGFFVAYK